MDSVAVDWDLLSSYAGLLGLACFSIYAGAHGSLPSKWKNGMKGAAALEGKGVANEGKEKPEESTEGEASDDEDEEDMERMSSEDAWIFPIIGSAALVGLYGIVKYLGETWINWLLGWYFAFAGVGSVWNALISLTRWALGDVRWKKYDSIKLEFKKGSEVLFKVSSRTPSLALLSIAWIPSAVYILWSGERRPVLVTDILALSFSHNALSLLRLDSFKTGCILLCGLFVYDVWWVFGTEVMVKVATRVDVPIKILWPKSVSFGHGRGFTMLGLGDIVIPGTFVALGLRYDYWRQGRKGRYFYATLFGYIVGLLVTITVMDVFGKAQPALLYLSPSCILSLLITGLASGEMQAVWKWVDA
ncbi:hypothetical protein CVT24_003100 [Panaeolus cyanescens]|uniref:Peptidase A22B, signal peptide peptidase n=1 Tax=Panaeolus cyanescens TaxID=181874 RepID=A0A409YXY9_9AGAR|nr:hypothetical protein CVT24_003100 [Panaeolus cyanescens]